MYTELEDYIRQQVLPGVVDLKPERTKLLDQIISAIKQQKTDNNTTKLLFVCTHNSRRSQLAQVWAWVAQCWYKVDDVESHSAGTEATTFHPNAIAALGRAGLSVNNNKDQQILLKVDDNTPTAVFFSKTTEHPSIPDNSLIAIMTCSDAEQNCPFIPGAISRIPLRYTDPKISDNGPNTAEVYDKTCLQIATEMFYLMQQLA